MRKYIGLIFSAVLLVALVVGCSGSFGFDDKNIGGLGTETGGGGAGGGGTSGGENNPFEGTEWKQETGSVTLSFDSTICTITDGTAKMANIARETISGEVIAGSYSYKWEADGNRFTATLKYSSGDVYATFEFYASTSSGKLMINNTVRTFNKVNGSGAGTGTGGGTASPDSFKVNSEGRLTAYTGTEAVITIPETVKYINNAVFKDNKVLTSVTIPDGVIVIGDEVFAGCSKLRNVTLPASVESIGSNAFATNSSATVNYEGTEDDWSYILRCYYQLSALTARDGTGLCYGNVKVAVNGVVINASKTHWKNNEAGMNIERYEGTKNIVKIPEGATGINANAFKNNGQITEVTIPNTVTNIGEDAFNGCSKLAKVTIHKGMKTIGGNAFKDCISLESVEIPDTVNSIGVQAFADCSSLVHVTISNKLESIAGSMFFGCEKLESVEIPSSVKSIGKHAFADCSSLKTVSLPGVKKIEENAFNGSGLEKIVIPASMTRIEDATFSGCSNLTDITIPVSIYYIGAAFGGCDKLTNIKYEGTEEQWNKMMYRGSLYRKTITGKDAEGKETTWISD